MGSSSSIEKKVQTIKEPDDKPNPHQLNKLADLARSNHEYMVASEQYYNATVLFMRENKQIFAYLCYEKMAEMQIRLENYEYAAEIYFSVGELGIITGRTFGTNGTLTMFYNALLCLLAAGQHNEGLKKIKTNCDYPRSSFKTSQYCECIEGFVYCESLEKYKNILEQFKPLYSDSEYRTKLVEKITSLQEERFKKCLVNEI